MQYPIYMDYQATTPVDKRVVDKMVQYMTTHFGNASSVDHILGDRSRDAVSEASGHVADLVGASKKNVVFTSGATESINLAVKGFVDSFNSQGQTPTVAVSPVEHKAVLDTCSYLESKGAIALRTLKVDSLGRLDLANLRECLSSGVDLLCVMYANNEIGNIYPILDIAQMANDAGTTLLCDASQAVGRVPISFLDLRISFLVLSAHKIYGPQGVGALIVDSSKTRIHPQIHGGAQQSSLRAGTLNLAGIVGLGEACRLRSIEMLADEDRIKLLRDKLLRLLAEGIPELILHGDPRERIAGNLNLSVPGLPIQAVLARLRDRLAISTGSACTSGIESPSHVLTAMNLPEEQLEGTMRISLGKFSTDEEVESASRLLIDQVNEVRSIVKPSLIHSI